MPKPIFHNYDGKITTTNCLLKKCGQCGGAKGECKCDCHFFKQFIISDHSKNTNKEEGKTIG